MKENVNLRWRRFVVTSLFPILVLLAFLPSAESEDISPKFLTKPRNKTIRSGNNVDFNCKASGFPTPDIKWYKNGILITTKPKMYRHYIGGLTKTLYIIPVYWKDAGQITCEASNQAGTIRTHVYLRVVSRTRPTWLKAPHNVTLYKGQGITIPCTADGYPKPSYRWTKGVALAESDPSIMVRPDGGLIFLSASLTHRGSYTCVATNEAGQISKDIDVNVFPDPSIIRDPKDAVGVVGENFSLQCVVIGNPTINVTWEKDGTILDIQKALRKIVVVQKWEITAKLYTLTITRAVASDAGEYKCAVINGKVRILSKQAIVTLTGISDPPDVKVPLPIRRIAKGADAILKCIFTGTPLPQTTWFKDVRGTLLQLNKTIMTVSKDSVETSLLLGAVSRSDQGVYYCKGRNSAGVTTGNITLIVPADPRKPAVLPGQSSFPGIRDHNITISCRFTGNPQPEVEWYKDDQELADELGQTIPGHNDTYVAYLKISHMQYKDAGRYVCRAINPYGQVDNIVTLVVTGRPMPPDSLHVQLKSRTIILVSWTPGISGGLPVFYTIEYKHNDSNTWTEVPAGSNTSKNMRNKDGWYGLVFTVRASNSYGKSKPSQTFYLEGKHIVTETRNPERVEGKYTMVIGASGGVLFFLILLLIILLFLWRKRISKKNGRHAEPSLSSVLYTRSHNEEDELLHNSGPTYSYVSVGSSEAEALDRKLSAEENNYQTIGRLAKWEVPKRCLTMDRELGKGHFGKVMKAFMNTEAGTKPVAVKMLKDSADALHKKEFLAELELMKSLKPHPNIVGLIGSCTKGDNPYIIVEFCALGSLQDLLRKSQGDRVYSNLAGGSTSLTSRDLLSFMWQVARGMSYLESLKLVHRDLATRNVLVDTGNVCKVADFGLARDIYEDNHYLKTTEGELPLRWMALESIFHGITTTESDVWSFGVLMWEIITLGAKPYPGFNREQLISNLHLGYRMPRPSYCKEELYAIIWQCWKKEPTERPNFSMLCRTLNRMLAAEKVLIDLDNLDAKYINATSNGEPFSPTAKDPDC